MQVDLYNGRKTVKMVVVFCCCRYAYHCHLQEASFLETVYVSSAADLLLSDCWQFLL